MILNAFYISFKVVVVSVIISLIVTLIAINILIEKKVKGKNLIETIMIFPMFLPPSSVGYLVLIALGRRGFLGSMLYENFNISIIFTWFAAVIVGVIVSLPVMYQSIKTSILSIDEDIKNAAREMGASEFQVFRKISLPLCKKGILTGLILSIARVFGEFGATILVAGNIPGETQTVPMAMYYAIENNDVLASKTILIIIVIISIVLTCLYNKILKRIV
ncbi:molybdenum ABC transporter permease subunit [Clostridium baratii]|uniref:Molybdenum transport system permease n=1 Tax=Clostridium baratii TaxID=1561 RepID=A0A174TDI5_9CLOT|nr:molybdate ABC transporter permease subunit [Clostridium baratii]OPF52656.1 molybdenum ABC transporter permease subunit [Clostridium baratii]OPF56106.1 molybdenum ABC transporter permease subunit [Clostridium baratii]OPF58299.1 molybdenum ABC transporter permease subunit [Clostridium baratii]OPF59512.1 molybdenum ABC transporter permease subunit [Clostridium baratii]CUQ05988.1 molybdate ABC transporter permease [Clostridium baratii]